MCVCVGGGGHCVVPSEPASHQLDPAARPPPRISCCWLRSASCYSLTRQGRGRQRTQRQPRCVGGGGGGGEGQSGLLRGSQGGGRGGRYPGRGVVRQPR